MRLRATAPAGAVVSVPPPVEPNSRADWTARYAGRHADDKHPSRWVIERSALLPRESWVCDVAGGMGRHAVPLAARGHHVVLLDFVENAVRMASQRSARIYGVVADVRALAVRDGTFDAVVVTNFLDRDLIPALIALLKPGGHLLYETYTTVHVALVAAGLARAPRSARFLLQADELRALVAPLSILDYREGDIEDEAGRRGCASVHAVRSEV